MEPTEGSETSADLKLTPGKYPKEHIQYSKHDESLKSRILQASPWSGVLLEKPVTAHLTLRLVRNPGVHELDEPSS